MPIDLVSGWPQTNRPPSANAGVDASTPVGTGYVLSGSVSDPDGDPVTYGWTIAEKPSGSTPTFTGTNTLSPTFTPDLTGEYTLTLSASDGILSTSDNVVITGTVADQDGDGIPDGSDNCPGTYNPGQANQDGDLLGDACDPFPLDPDNDADGDGISGPVDNCPAVYNPGQANRDGDALGDACDPDADGDGYYPLACASYPSAECPYEFGLSDRGPDCNDADSAVHPVPSDITYPSATYPLGYFEIPGNGKDDDCDASTLDGTSSITFKVTSYKADAASAEVFCSDTPGPTHYDSCYRQWLPADGATVTVEAEAFGPSGQVVSPVFTFTTARVTARPGKYTNDSSLLPADWSCEDAAVCPDLEVTSSRDGSGNPTSNPISLLSHDFGGVIRICASTMIEGSPFSDCWTLPQDDDSDDLPDAWEELYAGAGGHIDPSYDGEVTYKIDGVTPANPNHGDGLTALEEYRGFRFGFLTLKHGQKYQDDGNGSADDPAFYTDALVYADPSVVHFRTDPVATKDLFVRHRNYHAYDAGDESNSPFAIGLAFREAGIEVHPVDDAVMTTLGIGDRNLDVLNIVNDLTGSYAGTTYGNDTKRNSGGGPRQWDWATKGKCNPTVDPGTGYLGGCKTYEQALVNYIGQRPYLDQSPLAVGEQGNLVLDPIDCTGFSPCDAVGDTRDIGGAVNWNKRGDHWVNDPVRTFNLQFSVFDVDGDGLVENPEVNHFSEITVEYRKRQLLKHTITHEVGHAIGPDDLTDCGDDPLEVTDGCVMFYISFDWMRDGHFGNAGRAAFSIHNQ